MKTKHANPKIARMLSTGLLVAVVVVLALALVIQADYPTLDELRAMADFMRPVIIPLTGGQ